jgi:serine protease Do
MIGEPTIAVGNPVGLNNTVTTGVISALHRELEIAGRLIYRDVIQTDASINPGNSGGPLLNILGELIGVNTAVRTDAQNIGFAIPVEQLRRILPDVLDSEKHNKVLVGMVVSETQPPKVVEVRADGPAAAAGVKTGDVVTAIDGQPVQRGVDFYVHVLGRKAGEKLRLGLVRDGVSRDASLTLLSMPKPDGRRLARERLGLTVADVGEQASRRFPWTRERGVLVLAVEPRSAADQADLRPGDLVISLARHAVTDVDHFGALLTNVPAGDAADIGVLREHRGMIYYLEERIHVR